MVLDDEVMRPTPTILHGLPERQARHRRSIGIRSVIYYATGEPHVPRRCRWVACNLFLRKRLPDVWHSAFGVYSAKAEMITGPVP